MVLNHSNSSKTSKGMELLFSMLLLLVFILCAVFTILIGSRVYENIRARDNDSFYSDTALGYVTNKVRQSDSEGSVTIRDMDGQNVLVLTTAAPDGSLYETWIYTMDGSLKELYSEKDSGLTVEDGLDIMECAPLRFSFDERERMLSISLETSDSVRTASLLLRSDSKGGQ